MSQTKVLSLWLEGPMQSWGDRSRFGKRTTDEYPAKSGVVGLLFAALGWGGSQVERLEKLLGLKMSAYRFVRKELTSRLVDFQVVGHGYDVSDPWENLLVPKTMLGKKPAGKGTKVTFREYLQDACFAVFLEVPSDWEIEIDRGLRKPVWDLYLGRKCCVPSEPVYHGLFPTEDEARTALMAYVATRSLRLVDVMFDFEEGDEMAESFVRHDVPLAFGEEKKYLERRVSVKRIFE